jgi:anion-transporting  ArsA/GET3 family ATPase
VDPITLLALANSAVAAVKKGCQLYKDIKGAAGNVKEVLDDLEKTFKSKHKDKPPSQEAIKQYNEERARVKEIAQHDPNDVISQVGDNLNQFFEAFDQIEQLFWQEERNSKKVYKGEDSLAKRALRRVLIRTRLERMQVEMREMMIYNAPAELGDLWTRFQSMREQIEKEQEQARAEERRDEARVAFERDQLVRKWKGRAWDLVLVFIVTVYIWGLLWQVSSLQARVKAFLSS